MEKVNGFVKAKGTKLVNGIGEEILLKGVGLGGWLLPEGYMWRFPKEGDRPRKMEAFIEKSIGFKEANNFWHKYFSNFITEADIAIIKKEGFNSIRLPFNSRKLYNNNSFNMKNIEHIDRIINLCEKYKLYVILDMHGVLGGQTGSNIDDSEEDTPYFFIDRVYQEQTIKLWRFLAERYKDKYIIAGYDLMNEPLPKWFSKYNNMVVPLYEEIIREIRKVDKKHMIILEGVHWSTDWSIFERMPDNNVMLQFHKYWSNPDQESIQQYLDARERFNVPIFMGEGGENNLSWYTGIFAMLEDLDISWNFWTYKKMATNNSPCSIKMPKGWHIFINHLQQGTYPGKELAQTILDEFIENIKFSNCYYNKNVIDALLRRVPVKIPAIFYDYSGVDKGFHVEKVHKDFIGFRKKDGMYIGFLYGDRHEVNFAHSGGEEWQEDERTVVRLHKGEWVNYFVTINEEGYYFLNVHNKPLVKGSKIIVCIGDYINIEVSLEHESWNILKLHNKFLLKEGKKDIRIRVKEGTIELEWLQLKSTM